MKLFKKLLVVFMIAFISMLTFTFKSVQASSNNTPWTFIFDDTYLNIKENQTGFLVHSDSLTITYNDVSGNTTGSNFTLFYQVYHLEVYEAIYYDEWIENGESITINTVGGPLWFRTDTLDIHFTMHRSLDAKVQTNYIENQFTYTGSVNFVLIDDYPWDFQEVVIYWYNLDTKENGVVYDYEFVLSLSELGNYKVVIVDSYTKENKEYNFSIVEEQPLVIMQEYAQGAVTKRLFNNQTTTAGVTFAFLGSSSNATISYSLSTPTNQYINGQVSSDFIFWRKGNYTVYAYYMGELFTFNFVITSYDLVLDPANAHPYVGTEVTLNNGNFDSNIMTKGYTRCIYLGSEAPSQSRLDYNFYSADPTIATVSIYGTITAHKEGIVKITVVNKNSPSLRSEIIIFVLP